MGNVGSSQPKNKTGKKVVQQKVENAKKTGVLSLREHNLEVVPELVFTIQGLRTLDLSKNNIKGIGAKLASLSNLKSLNCDDNNLRAGSLAAVSRLSKLQTLSVGSNKLGDLIVTQDGKRSNLEPLPALPAALKQIKIDDNSLSSVPRQICSVSLVKLEKLDLSKNLLAAIPCDIRNLVSLCELNLDENLITSLPEEMGSLAALKALSLRNNKIQVRSTNFSPQNPQPLPKSLFEETPLIDLNLHGNMLTNTQLNEFEGFGSFLERRTNVKTKNVYGGALVNLSVCGLE